MCIIWNSSRFGGTFDGIRVLHAICEGGGSGMPMQFHLNAHRIEAELGISLWLFNTYIK